MGSGEWGLIKGGTLSTEKEKYNSKLKTQNLKLITD
jgi:hypothetical protein